MAILYLIRHGQASFGQANYDQLSQTGRRQAQFIPGHFRQAGRAEPTAVYAGSMQRQRQTAVEAFPGVSIRELSGLNEFGHEEVLRLYLPEVFDRPPSGKEVSEEEIKTFLKRHFPLAMNKWIQEEEGVYQESYSAFKGRCMEAFREMLRSARAEGEKEVIAFTSGGFVSLIMTQVLQMPDRMFPELNLGIANASVTAFLFNDTKVSLAYFNNYSYLPKELVRFR